MEIHMGTKINRQAAMRIITARNTMLWLGIQGKIVNCKAIPIPRHNARTKNEMTPYEKSRERVNVFRFFIRACCLVKKFIFVLLMGK